MQSLTIRKHLLVSRIGAPTSASIESFIVSIANFFTWLLSASGMTAKSIDYLTGNADQSAEAVADAPVNGSATAADGRA